SRWQRASALASADRLQATGMPVEFPASPCAGATVEIDLFAESFANVIRLCSCYLRRSRAGGSPESRITNTSGHSWTRAYLHLLQALQISRHVPRMLLLHAHVRHRVAW